MPNCFQLVRKTDKSLAVLQTVDEEMCKHFGVFCNAKTYHAYWYQCIGLALACGKTFEDLRDQYRKEAAEYCLKDCDREEAYISMHYIAICDWLDANFTVNAFYQR